MYKQKNGQNKIFKMSQSVSSRWGSPDCNRAWNKYQGQRESKLAVIYDGFMAVLRFPLRLQNFWSNVIWWKLWLLEIKKMEKMLINIDDEVFGHFKIIVIVLCPHDLKVP